MLYWTLHIFQLRLWESQIRSLYGLQDLQSSGLSARESGQRHSSGGVPLEAFSGTGGRFDEDSNPLNPVICMVRVSSKVSAGDVSLGQKLTLI